MTSPAELVRRLRNTAAAWSGGVTGPSAMADLLKDAAEAIDVREAFTPADMNLIRQWYDAVCDLAPEYLDEADKALGKKITEAVRRCEQEAK